MEVYERQTAEAIQRFLDHVITFRQCKAALRAALSDSASSGQFRSEDLPELRGIIKANHDAVKKEVDRRLAADKIL